MNLSDPPLTAQLSWHLSPLAFLGWRVQRVLTGFLALLGLPAGVWGPFEAPVNVAAIARFTWRRAGARAAALRLLWCVREICWRGAWIAYRPNGGLSGYPRNPRPDEVETPWLTLEEAAAYLKASPRWIDSNPAIPRHNVALPDRRPMWRFFRPELDAYGLGRRHLQNGEGGADELETR